MCFFYYIAKLIRIQLFFYSFLKVVIIMKKYKVGIVGATGMVGQRFALLLADHPWFEVAVLAASPRSKGKKYYEAVDGRWAMTTNIPEKLRDMVVLSATDDIEEITAAVDFVFCAVDMKKDEIRALEELYAKHECPVISNNSAHRGTPDVPMIVPELNPEHAEIINGNILCPLILEVATFATKQGGRLISLFGFLLFATLQFYI